MEQFIIKLKDNKRRFFLLELLKQLDFIKIESIGQNVQSVSEKEFTVLEVYSEIARNYKFDRDQANER